MNSNTIKNYKYNGARSMVILHERYLISFYRTWLVAKNKNILLPKTTDKDYESLDTLLQHVLRSARGYMVWICKNLDLPNPNIKDAPEADIIEGEAELFLSHILSKWSIPLTEIDEDKFHSQTFTSHWGVEYCIDAMLEHAVMHPIRHEFQLQNLIDDQRKN